MRKFLLDRSVIPIFEMTRQMANPHPVEHLPPPQSWAPPPNVRGGPGFGRLLNTCHLLDNLIIYYPPAELPPSLDRPSHHGISAYGRDAPIGARASSTTQSAPSMVTQTSQQMQIPVSYADAVIGTAGASISYIRRISWATVTIEETRGVPGEMTVEIGGTTSQVQTAQQLIQNFMAEAAPSQPQGGTDQDFNSYPAAPPTAAHASVYTSPPSNSGHAGGYGPVFGANYGF